MSSSARETFSLGRGSTRFVHLTDIHLWSQREAIDGVWRALDSINRLDPAPDFVLTGGDHVMDVFAADHRAAKAQWDLYCATIACGMKFPIFPVLGNHDIWGWGEPSCSTHQTGYGKAMALDRLGLVSSYYSFDRGGWHFICLDNVAPRGDHYTAALNEEQLEWLRDDLAAAGHDVPICLVSHIPLVAACVFFDDSTARQNGYQVHQSCMQADVGALLDLLRPADRPYNVKLALSGHIHRVDRVDYRGISFLCNGSVCGNWWQGPCQGFEPGYAVIDVRPDGTYRNEYVSYANG